MKVVEGSIRYPVTTAVAVLLLVLFGLISLLRIPIQLTPTVDKPEISVRTLWPGASPKEVERQIVQEQEEQLKGMEGLERIESTSALGRGEIVITLQVGADLNVALLNVANRLQQVQRYPEDALKPSVRSASTETMPIAWFSLQETGGRGQGVYELRDFVEDFVVPEFERVSGVATTTIYGGQNQEMQFVIDPARLAARRITIAQVAAALRREGLNTSGGDFDEGKNNYLVRTVGEYAGPEDIEDIVVAFRNGVPVFAREVGYARLGFRKKVVGTFVNEQPAILFNVAKAPGANVLDVMRGLKEVAARVEENLLTPRGLTLVQMYDETEYVHSAIGLVRQAIYLGGLLAILVLLVFLRSGSSTLVIAVAMPISIVGTFLMMNWFGRTINVISLAGMAFAIGMVVDNSIVVLENIYRHRQMGKGRFHGGASTGRRRCGARCWPARSPRWRCSFRWCTSRKRPASCFATSRSL